MPLSNLPPLARAAWGKPPLPPVTLLIQSKGSKYSCICRMIHALMTWNKRGNKIRLEKLRVKSTAIHL